jgi:hypothetical protein
MANKSLILKPKARTYTVYGIQNTVTGKWYIGITTQIKKRKNDHFSHLRTRSHHSQRLQNSFNKHGEAVFQWHILEERIPEKISNNREKRWIALFDSYKNGYNMTEGGDGVTYSGWSDIPTTWNGGSFQSKTEAARRLGIHTSTLHSRLKKGYGADQDMVGSGGHNKPNPCVWEGVEYMFVKDAAESAGVHLTTMLYRLKRGYQSDTDISHSLREITWNGKTYPSISEAARVLGITKSAMWGRISKGYTKDSDMPGTGSSQGSSCIWNNVEYSSLTEASRILGVHHSTMAYRISKGYTCDEDLKNNNSKGES